MYDFTDSHDETLRIIYSDSWKELYYIDQCDFFFFFNTQFLNLGIILSNLIVFLSFLFERCELSWLECLGRWLILVIPDS